jgi:hypothetical protein
VNDSLHLQNSVAIRFTEPHESERLLTVQIGDQVATISCDDTDRLYLWLHEHRISFISFYGKGWKLAQQYFQAEGEPSSYHDRLALFNDHCHEIGVAPYSQGDTELSELAVNGFFAAIHHMEAQRRGGDIL